MQQQQGGGQVDVITSVAMGALHTLYPFLCCFFRAFVKRMFLCAIHFNYKTTFVLCLFFVTVLAACWLARKVYGLFALNT